MWRIVLHLALLTLVFSLGKHLGKKETLKSIKYIINTTKESQRRILYSYY